MKKLQKKVFKGSIDKIKLFIQRKNSSTYDYVSSGVLKKENLITAVVLFYISAGYTM
ncbi:MAG: hypothetical protein IPI04_18410 [Ignavibacteria bacterium]|nr:hypothetical protein [Ignavibacteria bacterium]